MRKRGFSDSTNATAADCMRRKRHALYADGYVQTKMQIPESFAEHLKSLKEKYKLRGLDNVVSTLIRKAAATYSPNELIVPPPPEDANQVKKIAVHIPKEHHAFLEAVAHRNRGITLGVALETVAAHVRDLSPLPQQEQFSLIGGGNAVTG